MCGMIPLKSIYLKSGRSLWIVLKERCYRLSLNHSTFGLFLEDTQETGMDFPNPFIPLVSSDKDFLKT